MDKLSHLFFFNASVISLLKLLKTPSTIFIDFLSVTLNPLIKSLLIPASFNLLEILFPPPWIMTGIKPNLLSIEISLIKLLNKKSLQKQAQ